jgi:hypothetical protein
MALRARMGAMAAVLVVVFGLMTGASMAAHADHWPPDIWERLDSGF